MPPLEDVLLAATDTLAGAGIATPADDARVLAAHVLALPDTRGLGEVEQLDRHHAATLHELVERRAARVPLPHLTGHVTFRGLTFEVGPGVFVPQPETGPVVDRAVAAVRSSGRSAPVVVDLCTGAGTIALSIAHELPQASVHAVERDPAALAWARRNGARREAAGDRPVTFHLDDAATCLPDLDGQVDLVVSNPPYVATGERHVPAPEVVDHDPAMALWAGADGLSLIRTVEATARRLLCPGGTVVVEHSDRQGRTAPAVFTSTGGWSQVADHVDLDGLDRFVTARRQAAAHAPARSHRTRSRTAS